MNAWRLTVRDALLSLLVLIGTVAALGVVPGLLRRDRMQFMPAGGFGEDVLTEPIGIATLGNRVYVTDAARNAVMVFDTTGQALASHDTLDLARPMHLTASGDSLYIAEYLHDRVTVLSPDGHVLLRHQAPTGGGTTELDAPGGAAAAGGRIYVADFYNHRVTVLGGGGPVGAPGRVLAGRIHYPTDVEIRDSLLYVADAYNHRVQVFRLDGSYVRRWGGPFGMGLRGGLRGWFRVATGLTVRHGRVYVADFENHRVQIFNTTGQYQGQISEGLRLPTDVAVAADGTVFVADFGHRRIARFSPAR